MDFKRRGREMGVKQAQGKLVKGIIGQAVKQTLVKVRRVISKPY
jgi:hypothetical protein